MRGRQEGSVAFFVTACVLPLLVLILSISLDVSSYLRTLQAVTEAMDDAALQAYRYLPDVDAASGAARSHLRAHSAYSEQIRISIEKDAIILQLDAQMRLFLAELLGIPGGIRLTAASRTRGTPFDVMLAVDSSSYLAPDQNAGTPWGGPGWGAADFFNLYPIYGDKGAIAPELLTQRCFNPAFSTLKKAALTSYQYLSGFDLNNIGLAFYPGREPVEISRTTARLESGDYAPASSYDAFSPLCAAAAEREINHVDYRFPRDRETGGIQQRILDMSWVWNPDYNTTVEDVIWSRSAQERCGDLPRLVEQLGNHLLASKIVTERGNLRFLSQKAGVIFAGDLPRIGCDARFPSTAVQRALEMSLVKLGSEVIENKADLRIYYVLFAHEGNSGISPGDVRELRDFFRQQRRDEDRSRFAVELIYSDDPREAVGTLLQAVLLDKKSVMISR